MTKEFLLTTLRRRLAFVSIEISWLDNVRNPDQQEFIYNHGKIAALHSEQLFLADLITILEREGVQP